METKKTISYQNHLETQSEEPLVFKINKLAAVEYLLEVEDNDYSQTKKYELEISLDGIHYHFAALNDYSASGREYASEDQHNENRKTKKSQFKFQLPENNLHYYLRLKKVFNDGAFTLYGPLNIADESAKK